MGLVSGCDLWWHGWCLGMGWSERDEIPEVVLCWDCNPAVRKAREEAEGDDGKQKEVELVQVKLKRLAIKRRCK